MSEGNAVAWRWRYNRLGDIAWHLSASDPGDLGPDYDVEPLYGVVRDAWMLRGYHRICEEHGIAPSSSELVAAAKRSENGEPIEPQPQWTERLAHIERRTPVEEQAALLKTAVEALGAHPLLTKALNAVDLAMRTLGKWHDEVSHE